MTKIAVFLIGLAAISGFWFKQTAKRDFNRSMWMANEQTRIELNQTLRLQELRYELRQPAASDREWRQVADEVAKQRSQANALREQRDELRAAIPATRKAMADYQAKTIAQIRLSRIGTHLGDFVCRTGRKLSDVSVIDIRDAGVTVRHKNGISRLGFEDLSDSQRVFFGMEEKLSNDALEAERKKASEYVSWFNNRMEQLEREKETSRKEEVEAEKYRRPISEIREPVAFNKEPSPSRLSAPARKINTSPERRYRVRSESYTGCRNFYYVAPAPCRISPFWRTIQFNHLKDIP